MPNPSNQDATRAKKEGFCCLEGHAVQDQPYMTQGFPDLSDSRLAVTLGKRVLSPYYEFTMHLSTHTVRKCVSNQATASDDGHLARVASFAQAYHPTYGNWDFQASIRK